MKVLHLGSNEKKILEKDLNKIESRFAEGKQKMNGLKLKLKKIRMLEGNNKMEQVYVEY